MTAKDGALLFVVCAAILLTPASGYSAETLGEVLGKHGIAPASHASPERAITSYAVLDEPTVFCIAFYWDNQAEYMDWQLEVLLVDRTTGQARTTTLHYKKLVPGKPDFRTGSITRLIASPGYLFIGGHNNPSAGHTLVLSKDLAFQTSLYGSPMATFENDILVFHKSQMHFAPVHAAEIAIYDPHTRKEEQIYPREPYQEVRRDHVNALKRAFDSRPIEWFAQHNRPNDPERFNNSLAGRVVVNDSHDALAFLIAIDTKDLRPDEDRQQLTRVAYVYRGIGKQNLKYKEILEEQLESRFGVSDLSELIQPEILARIFE